jgi:HEPN domain-containing protein
LTASKPCGEWLRLAKADLAIAQIGDNSGFLLELLCFHAQQATEKAIKGLLSFYDLGFKKTHNISDLLKMIPDSVLLPVEVKKSSLLTEYAVSARYPSFYESVTPYEYRVAVDNCFFCCGMG